MWGDLAVWALENPWLALVATILAGAGLSSAGLLLLGLVDRRWISSG